MRSLLATFAQWDRSFSIEEIMSWAEDAPDSTMLRQALYGDSRFLPLGHADGGTELYIPEHAALKWWFRLAMRLVEVGKTRLEQGQLAATMNSLHPFAYWSKPSAALVQLGQRHGMVAPAWSPGIYVLPVVQLLREQTVAILRYGSQVPLFRWCEEDPTSSGDMPLQDVLESLLNAAGERASQVIRGREGIPSWQRSTLEALGTLFGVTRERIRQIEGKFWKRLYHPRNRGRLRMLWFALVDVVSKPGGMVRPAGEELTPYTCLAAKCLRIPFTKVGDLVVLGASEPIGASSMSELGWSTVGGDSEEVAAILDSRVYPFLDHLAIRRVAQAIADGARSKLTKQEKVYLALKYMGRSAHYSEVAQVYDQMYPEDEMSVHNVHAILSRCASPDLELYGIVYVGAKGTYGLREQGYIRPGMPLFDTVTKIVREKYDATQKPVHLNAIVAELGRYRHGVNSASLAFATGMNTAIREVEKDHFVPNGVVENEGLDSEAAELDKVLRDFREAHAEEASASPSG